SDLHGLGWIICPLTRMLSAGMDQLYSILQGFLLVRTLTNDTGSTIYTVWGMVRNFANALFIAGFLIIIYSQITSVGISNYGIKRLMPRLIIAAVLVNLSYWVCALAVDASNLLGVYIQDALTGVIDSIDLEGNVSIRSITWQELAGG